MKSFRRGFLVLLPVLCVIAVADPAFDDIVTKIGNAFESFMKNSTPAGAPMKRAVFGKDHGCLKATFEMDPAVDKAFRIGAFKADSHSAWIRFSNDGAPGDDQEKVNRGMSIKLVGVVEGPKLLQGYEDAVTQDFILENHPVFFVDNAVEFKKSIYEPDYRKTHQVTDKILTDMENNVLADPLDGTYWTPTPYRLGKNDAMKYMVTPCTTPPDPSTKPMTSKDYLRENLIAHMKEPGEKCMRFYVQLQVNEDLSPTDRATVKWTEEGKGKWKLFATIHIPAGQDINSDARRARCESLSFNVMHTTADMAPLGSLNAARAIVYKRLAETRRIKPMDTSEPTEIKATE